MFGPRLVTSSIYPVSNPSWWVSSDSPFDEISVSVSSPSLPTVTKKLLVSSLPQTNYYLPTSLAYYNEPLVYSGPIYNNITYLDINADKELQKSTTKYFFSRLYNDYVPESSPEILDYVKLNARDVELVKSVKQAKQNSTKNADFREKITYLAENIFTKNDIFNVLVTFVNKNSVNWWNLEDMSEDVCRILVKRLEEKIKSMLKD